MKKKLKDLIREKGRKKGLSYIPPFDETSKNIIKLGEDLLQHVLKKPEHQAINKFTVEKKIPLSYLRRYARENIYFAKAFEIARTAIAIAVAENWHGGSIHESLAVRFMEIYNDEWRELLREKYQTKKDMDRELSEISVIEIPTWNTGTRKPKKKTKEAQA
jgi:hypothetical protein